jgi:hypothetical protein
MTVTIENGLMLATIAFEMPKRVPSGKPVLCPECGEQPSGTVEVLDSLAEITVGDPADPSSIEYTGYTNPDVLWESQKTVYLDKLPVLYCKGMHTHTFVHEDVKEIR